MTKSAQATGKLPKAIEGQPEIWEPSLSYWQAFWFLSSGRPVTVTMNGVLYGTIQVDQIAAYLDFYRITSFEEREDQLILIRALDAVYVEHMNKPQPKAKPKPSGA